MVSVSSGLDPAWGRSCLSSQLFSLSSQLFQSLLLLLLLLLPSALPLLPALLLPLVPLVPLLLLTPGPVQLLLHLLLEHLKGCL